jgi:hypothetical protein
VRVPRSQSERADRFVHSAVGELRGQGIILAKRSTGRSGFGMMAAKLPSLVLRTSSTQRLQRDLPGRGDHLAPRGGRARSRGQEGRARTADGSSAQAKHVVVGVGRLDDGTSQGRMGSACTRRWGGRDRSAPPKSRGRSPKNRPWLRNERSVTIAPCRWPVLTGAARFQLKVPVAPSPRAVT